MLRTIDPQGPGANDAELRFSFKYLDLHNPLFDFTMRDRGYFRRLLERLRELSRFRVIEFATHRSSALRIHPINFKHDAVAVQSFGVREWADADKLAWQFSLSANEHGRVHGFLAGNTFYVRWLDPEHNLYAGN